LIWRKVPNLGTDKLSHQEAARLHNKRTAAYLLGNPMLGDHLEEGLEKFGISSEGI
jgi:hypothetical protein